MFRSTKMLSLFLLGKHSKKALSAKPRDAQWATMWILGEKMKVSFSKI